jgi:Flp pilus assembly protein TadG
MHRRHLGQSLVEFALISTVFVLLLAITVDFARVYSAYISVGNMARAGAQYGTIANSMGATSENEARDGMVAAAYAEQDSIYGVTPDVDATVFEDSDGLCVVRVEVNYDFQPIILIPPIPGSVPISRTAEMSGQILDLCQ